MTKIIRQIYEVLLALLPKTVTVRILNGPLRGYRWHPHSGVATYWRGIYEQQTVNLLLSFIKPGMTCYDCGANAGYYTLLMSQAVGESGVVHSFEPNPVCAEFVRKHLSLNRIRNVQFHQVALSNKPGTMRFGGEGSIGQLRDDGDVEVRVESLVSLRIPPADFMKIDIEGAEVDLLDGGRDFIQTHKPTILLSLHIPIPLAEEIAAWFRSIGYSTKFIEGSYDLFAASPLHDRRSDHFGYGKDPEPPAD